MAIQILRDECIPRGNLIQPRAVEPPLALFLGRSDARAGAERYNRTGMDALPRVSAKGRATKTIRPPAPLRRKAARVDRTLEAYYGAPRRRSRLDPISTLVLTILSQNTSDTNSRRAFERLRVRFPSWEILRDAPVEAVIEAIHPAGLSALKAPRIQAVLRRITAERGELSLDFLRRWPVERAKA